MVDKKKMDEEKEECVRCGNRFKDKCELEEHMRKDHEFRCMFLGCEMRTEYRREMEEHEKSVHRYVKKS